MFEEKNKAWQKRQVIEETADMMEVYFRPENKPKTTAQWEKEFKDRVMKLHWQCHFEKIEPPVDLILLTGCLFGDRHNWSYAKYAVLNYLARHYVPTKNTKDLPRGTKSKVSRIISECGGVLQSPRSLDSSKGNEKSDYRKNLDGWIEEDLFFYIWEKKYQHFVNHSVNAGAIEAVKSTLS